MSFDQIKEEHLELAKKIGWRKPNFPFISFKCKKVEILGKEDKRIEAIEIETGLRPYDTIVNFNVGGVHRQIDKIEKIIRKKRYEVVAWGNFPAAGSVKANMTKGHPEEKDDWSKLDEYLKAFTHKQLSENKQIEALNKKVADLAAKLSEKDAKKEAKNAAS
jgi:hypothetical protein